MNRMEASGPAKRKSDAMSSLLQQFLMQLLFLSLVIHVLMASIPNASQITGPTSELFWILSTPKDAKLSKTQLYVRS